jgi:prepilin-type N-terminal cleavage/methylation domain-containing protein
MNQFDDEIKEQGETGMSLIEVMVSLTMLGVVLVILGQGLTLGIRMNTDSKAKVSSLNMCKQVMEKLKSQIQYSQSVFDGANTNVSFGRTFYADSYGEEVVVETTPGSSSADAAKQAMAQGSFKVTASVGDWEDSAGETLSATDANGATHVLVKVLTVTVVNLQNAVGDTSDRSLASREVSLSVEMVRPAS